MPKSMALQGAGLILFATGLKILASAVGQFASLNWQAMGKGLAGLGWESSHHCWCYAAYAVKHGPYGCRSTSRSTFSR
jgi:hypothetical protein